MRRPLIALVLVASLASLSGCTDEYVESSAELEASFKVRETVEQLIVSHATPGTELVVNDKDGSEVARGNADALFAEPERAITRKPPARASVARASRRRRSRRHLLRFPDRRRSWRPLWQSRG